MVGDEWADGTGHPAEAPSAGEVAGELGELEMQHGSLLAGHRGLQRRGAAVVDELEFLKSRHGSTNLYAEEMRSHYAVKKSEWEAQNLKTAKQLAESTAEVQRKDIKIEQLESKIEGLEEAYRNRNNECAELKRKVDKYERHWEESGKEADRLYHGLRRGRPKWDGKWRKPRCSG